MASDKQISPQDPCPCGSGQTLELCCGPIMDGAPAQTAEALMRSRYTAYALGHLTHLKNSLDAHWRASFDEEGTRTWSQGAVWQGLSILSTKGGGQEDQEGEVEFVAAFKMDGQDQHMRERARFRKRAGHWYYVDGKTKSMQDPVVASGPKVGRNDPCPCGSHKKYKKCCGA